MKRTRNNRVIKGLEAQIDIFLQNILPHSSVAKWFLQICCHDTTKSRILREVNMENSFLGYLSSDYHTWHNIFSFLGFLSLSFS